MQDNIDRENNSVVAHSFMDAIKQPATIFLSIVYLFMLMGLYGLTFWLPQLIKNTGIASPMTIGLLSTIPYAAAGVMMVLIARSSDRHGERRWHLGLCILAGGIGYVLSGLFGDNTAISIAALTLAAIGVIGCLPVFWTLPPKFLTGSAAAGGIALINSVGNLGGIISPYMVGKVKDVTGSTAGGLYAIAAVTILAALLVMFALPRSVAGKDSD